MSEFQFIECNATGSIETNNDNNKFTNKISDGISIPSGSKLTVESAFINALGAGSEVIQMKGEKIGDATLYKDGINATKSEVYDNKVTITLQYFKNGDGNYYYPCNFPYHDFEIKNGYGNNYDNLRFWNYQSILTSKGMGKVKGFTNPSPANERLPIFVDENQFLLYQTSNLSPFGYNFPFDNSRYTICDVIEETNSLFFYNNIGNFSGIRIIEAPIHPQNQSINLVPLNPSYDPSVSQPLFVGTSVLYISNTTGTPIPANNQIITWTGSSSLSPIDTDTTISSVSAIVNGRQEITMSKPLIETIPDTRPSANETVNFRRVETTLYEINREISRYRYKVHTQDVTLDVTEGYNTPSRIAEELTQQLNKTADPKIVNLTIFGREPTSPATQWNKSINVPASISMESPSYKLFNCANRRTFYEGTYTRWTTNTFLNTNVDVQHYQDNFRQIGVYNPELFILGKNIKSIPYSVFDFDTGIYSLSSYPQVWANGTPNFVITNTVTLPNTLGIQKLTVKTTIPYNKDVLQQFRKIFIQQINDNKFYENPCAEDISATPDTHVFIHMDTLDTKAVAPVHTDARIKADYDTWKKFPFGSDNSYSVGIDDTITDFQHNPHITNCLYIKRNNKDDLINNVFDQGSAFGIFRSYLPDQTKTGLYEDTSKPNILTQTYFNEDVQLLTGQYYTEFDIDLRVYNNTPTTFDNKFFDMILSKTPTFENGVIVENGLYRRIGWDTHFSANGNQSIMLWNGLQRDGQAIYNNVDSSQTSITKNVTYSLLDDASLDDYYYDTGVNKIYLGSQNTSIGFDTAESRFTIGNFHTPRFENNTEFSSFSKSVNLGFEDSDLFFPEYWNGTNFLNHLTDLTSMDLELNPNGGNPIYEISPPLIETRNTQIYGLLNTTINVIDTSRASSYARLKQNTVFDGSCGLYIASFGLDENTFQGSLWDLLGYNLNQINTQFISQYLNFNVDDKILLNRNARRQNSGVNLLDKQLYPFTTNANITPTQISFWNTNPFGAPYFNNLNLPIPTSSLTKTNGGTSYGQQRGTNGLSIVEDQQTSLLFSKKLASKTITPYYQIRSDILQDQYTYYGGNNNYSSRLPVVCVVNLSEPGADYYTSSVSMEFIIKKRLTINNIVTEIMDNRGLPAKNLSNYSSIIYRVERLYETPQITPFQTLRELEESEQAKQMKKKSK
jgi:hypothetical protein